jgi:hypothetical protein
MFGILVAIFCGALGAVLGVIGSVVISGALLGGAIAIYSGKCVDRERKIPLYEHGWFRGEIDLFDRHLMVVGRATVE